MAPQRRVIHYRTEEKMDVIPGEVWTAFGAIKDAIPPLPPELRTAFGLLAAGGLLLLVLFILNKLGK